MTVKITPWTITLTVSGTFFECGSFSLHKAEDGVEFIYHNGFLHNDNGPAVVYPDGHEEWYLDGKLHREDGPAQIKADGTEKWYLYGKRHREDGPAVTTYDGTKTWYHHGITHREDAPALVYPDGTEYWYINGELHREDGPAVTHNDGTKYWYSHGKLHREDGPALVYPDGTKQWWVNGRRQKRNEKSVWARKRGSFKTVVLTLRMLHLQCYNDSFNTTGSIIMASTGKSARSKGIAYEGLCRRWWRECFSFDSYDPSGGSGREGSDIGLVDLPFIRGEAKSHNKMNLAGWLTQARNNAIVEGADLAFVQHKKVRVGNQVEVDEGLGEHYITLRASDFARLLKTLKDNDITDLSPMPAPIAEPIEGGEVSLEPTQSPEGQVVYSRDFEQ